MSRSFKTSCILIAALSLAACGDDGDDTGSGSTMNPAGGGSDAGAAVCTPDTYANYGNKFFMTNCTVCHNASYDMSKMMNTKLDTLPGVQASKAGILQHAVMLVPPVMPMQGALPQADRDRLKKWLDCGAL